MQEPEELPGAAQQRCSSQTASGVSVKVEPNSQDERKKLRRDSGASKRKHTTQNDTFSNEPSGRKKKTKSNKDQDQMDKLLAVSLREEELSHSLQDMDKSLVQARNALQAAYAEVQRLLLMRQQFTSEVNSLRAKRIEILQGMQEVYSGASNVAERSTTSSGGTAATVQPPSLPAFPNSSSPQPPATTSASPKTQPHPTPLTPSAVSMKQEICHPPVTGPASHFVPTVSCNADALQVPLNQPVSPFPSDLLPIRMLTPPQLPTTAAAASAKQVKTECSTSAVTLPSPESSARQQQQQHHQHQHQQQQQHQHHHHQHQQQQQHHHQHQQQQQQQHQQQQQQQQQQEMKMELKDGVKTVVVAKKEPLGERDPEDKMGGNLSTEQRKGKEPAADRQIPNRKTKTSVSGNGGNDSDDSIEMIHTSNLEVIHIDESDCEDSPKAESNVPEPPQQSVNVEFSSSCTQMSQPSDADRKYQPRAQPAKDVGTLAESAEDEEPSVGAFLNHDGPVHGLQLHNGLLYTCSGDNTARAYSLVNRACQAVFDGHTNKINCLLVSSLPNMPTRLYTGSSDQTIRCHSIKSKKCLEQITLPDRVLCLHIAWNILYAGLANGSVASYDLKTLKQLDVFECHGPRGVSCLGTSQEGARRLLLVGSYDSTISVRDAKSGLLLRSLEGHTKTVLCMKVVNDLVFSGSSDTSVHAHNIHTGELVRIYKGHDHAVTSIVILGKVMVTACLDKLVRVYELQSHDRLQVYGGHSDMVMCMAVHKSVIYTGCYDGSVQAVKLNLMKNYRCWWQNCTLIFGMPDHLAQHLISDHSNPSLQTFKCRWRSCDTFYATQQTIRQEVPEHMRSHVDTDSRVQP
ncbi:zinc finger protein 106-like [Embiotoca jacksoni]|uniref:zinc finger protein 106-like n=1 Tax=Embiotoca jacksoni TaxID=100190 RepID=UPI00370448CC